MTIKFRRTLVVAAAAASLVAGPSFTSVSQAAPMPAADQVVAKRNDRNQTVQQIQGRLNGLGYLDRSQIIGIFGPATEAAVKRFQANNKLPATGVVNTTTHNLIATRYRNRKVTKPAPVKNTVVAKRGDRNQTVQQIQGRLNGLGYLDRSQIIGIFGPATEAAVKRFQANNKLPATGVVNTTTHNLIATRYRNRKVTKPAPVKNTVVAKRGDRNQTVQQIQGRLNGLGYLDRSQIIGIFGPATEAAVKRFQANNKLPATGVVNTTTHNLIVTRYRNRKTTPKPTTRLDSRCLTGRAVCIDKGDRKMYWVINGKIQARYDVRTGRRGAETRSGSFSVYRKHTNWYSTLYHVNMPYSMFFSGGQAIHYSSEFARIGYSGAGSHGCVNMRSMSDARWLFNQVRVGDKVIVTA
ncbi:L,D-transpeptidase family protein [Luteococcus sp. OSA5]|uniref:L,D-transpeptidase family protein n=1 Tax=Luteococcus sp. OSA5 TaxID=3401630 RepID=UPI003B4382B4